MKTCTKCGETKPRAEFYKQSASKDGLQYQCKVCAKAHSNEHEAKERALRASQKNEYEAKEAARRKEDMEMKFCATCGACKRTSEFRVGLSRAISPYCRNCNDKMAEEETNFMRWRLEMEWRVCDQFGIPIPRR